MILSDVCNISINFKDADFWINQHTGKPVEEFNPDFIGVKVVKTEILVSKYLYYYFLNLYNQGVLTSNVNTNIIKNIKLG